MPTGHGYAVECLVYSAARIVARSPLERAPAKTRISAKSPLIGLAPFADAGAISLRARAAAGLYRFCAGATG